jgi:REP-associated tyrosine transposase
MGHPPRIPVWLPWDQDVVYFITFCVAGRHKVLANPAAFTALQEAITDLTSWTVAGVLMPDHVHLLAAPNERDLFPGQLSAGIKRKMRRRLNASSWEWQSGCFDRLLRRDEHAQDKWLYIRENPVRAGLARTWEESPYRVGLDL